MEGITFTSSCFLAPEGAFRAFFALQPASLPVLFLALSEVAQKDFSFGTNVPSLGSLNGAVSSVRSVPI